IFAGTLPATANRPPGNVGSREGAGAGLTDARSAPLDIHRPRRRDRVRLNRATRATSLAAYPGWGSLGRRGGRSNRLRRLGLGARPGRDRIAAVRARATARLVRRRSHRVRFAAGASGLAVSPARLAGAAGD